MAENYLIGQDKLLPEAPLVERADRVPALQRLQAELCARVADVRGLLGQGVHQARQILRKLLVGRLDVERSTTGSGAAIGSPGRAPTRRSCR